MYVHGIYQISPSTYWIKPDVSTGFRGQHRDVLRSDIPQPPSARQDEDGGSPCPEDVDFFYARSDAAEIEEAISKFISGLESQEQSGKSGIRYPSMLVMLNSRQTQSKI